MNRRQYLALVGAASAAGTAGCTRLGFGRTERRLWYVWLHNTGHSQTIRVRVDRNGERVFADRFELGENWGSNEEDHPPETIIAGRDENRLIEGEWDTDPATFTVEYGRPDRESWTEARFSDVETEHVGLRINGRHFDAPSVGYLPHEFESAEEVRELLDRIDEERAEYDAAE